MSTRNRNKKRDALIAIFGVGLVLLVSVCAEGLCRGSILLASIICPCALLLYLARLGKQITLYFWLPILVVSVIYEGKTWLVASPEQAEQAFVVIFFTTAVLEYLLSWRETAHI